jgi:cytochrome c biogenesis protein CcdA
VLSDNNRQKSLKRRFLLILGIAAFICFCSLGVMIIFWDRMLPNIPKTQKIAIGAVIIIYGIIRFARLLKKDPYEV